MLRIRDFNQTIIEQFIVNDKSNDFMKSAASSLGMQLAIHVSPLIFVTFQMNYQFLKKCVESAPITPMQQELFDNILSMIPESLKKSKVCKDVIEELFEEISTDFNKSMKKSMGK